MKVSEIMISKIISLNLEDTVAKALNVMYENNINQVPIVDEKENYGGMIFAKDFLMVNAVPSAKLRTFVSATPILSPTDNIERCAQLIVATGKRALPVIQSKKIVGIVSETDVALTADFGHAIIDEVMSGAIVIEEDNTISNAMSKIRRYNISRLPVINSNGILTGVINAIDIIKILATPKDLLEVILPKDTGPSIHMAHLEDNEAQHEIEEEMKRFLNKIQGKLENINQVIIYADKHKTRKYSLRARMITRSGVIEAKAVAFDPISACKELISRFDRRIRSEHSQKVKHRQERTPARTSP